ncbi:MAG: DNA mismatch repair protein MutS [Bacteroidota bacterium]|nr:DNA mismatch repair protein MutS [Bacteroidota bacterium]
MVKNKKIEETPLMKQYFQIKNKYPDALLLFRVGDFYETFVEDAIKVSKILGIVLTSRSNGSSKVELAGFPHHSIDTYLPKLVKAGHRVAICEQLEDPKKTKTIVKRGVTELITPGTSTNDQVLNTKQNNYLAALYFTKKEVGAAFVDISTGEFIVAEGSIDYIENLVNSFDPSEIIYSKLKQEEYLKYFPQKRYTFLLEDWLFSSDYSYEKLTSHFKTKTLKGFGIENMNTAIPAAGAILHYLSENKQDRLKHLNNISRIEKDDFIWLDRFSIKNLELINPNLVDGSPLINVIDKTITPMGGRLLKQWIVMPLKDKRNIEKRLELVDFLFKNEKGNTNLGEKLSKIGDLERLISKVALRRINPREIRHIKNALSHIEGIKKVCENSENKQLFKINEKLNSCSLLQEKIDKILVDEPPVNINKGNFIKEGYSKELDKIKDLKKTGKEYILKLREREIVKTGISSLKVGYNSVFGYYLEVRNTHKDKVPEEWHRKQTLVSAERYITSELKEYEEKILSSEEKIDTLENEIYQELLYELTEYIHPIQINSKAIAYLDVLLSFANIAQEYNYTKPQINDSYVIDIKDGRHPVIEQNLPVGDDYIPNDIYLNNDNQQVIILTGPNMSGKSAVLRQTALIVLLAQIGSFVPASSAKIGIVDKIFTRVGASDNLSVGESTFMVEMLETASILNNVSERSLILLDEIGRGTSTYDGISIAWAITEFLHQNTTKPKTIFATHYHELNELASTLKRVRNLNISVKEYKNKVIFLRKLKPGGSEHSFGIHVAQMAGVPNKIVERAKLILEELEKQRTNIKNNKVVGGKVSVQLKMFDVTDPIYERVKRELNKIDINALTPIEAMMKLNYLKSLLKKDKG